MEKTGILKRGSVRGMVRLPNKILCLHYNSQGTDFSGVADNEKPTSSFVTKDVLTLQSLSS